MAGTREIRRRIKSVKNIGQITKAMELVAASKMRRAQEQALAGRRYNEAMYAMLGNLLAQTDPQRHVLLRQPEEQLTDPGKVLVIAFGPDKGLCGGLISNLQREVWQFKQTHPSVEFITMGRRIRDGVRKLDGTLVADMPLAERPHLGDVTTMTKVALDDFAAGTYRQVFLAHTRFINTLQQRPQIRQLLPLSREVIDQALQASTNSSEPGAEDYLYEPGVDVVLGRLLPRFVEMSVFQALLEALASEHSARMIAMKNAGDNAKELQQELTLTYNQLRQASITAELAEIAGAASE